MIKVWHNNRCGKSREAIKYLEEKNLEYEIFEYLKEPLTSDDIKNIITLLKIDDIREMLRSKETVYKENNLQNELLNTDEIIELIIQNPKLIERPIVINNEKAVIARPYTKIDEILV